MPPRLVFSLPGNPVSAMVCFELLVAPAMRRLAGHHCPDPPRVRCSLSSSVKLDPERPEYQRCVLRWDGLHDRYAAEVTGNQQSSRLMSFNTANGLLELPKGPGTIPAGTMVVALLVGEATLPQTPAPPTFLKEALQGPVPAPPLPSKSCWKLPAERSAALLLWNDGKEAGAEVLAALVSADCDVMEQRRAQGRDAAREVISAWDAEPSVALVFTCGGSSFHATDEAPEILRNLIVKEAPGLASLNAAGGCAALWRGVAGFTKNGTMVINLAADSKVALGHLHRIMPAVVFAMQGNEAL